LDKEPQIHEPRLAITKVFQEQQEIKGKELKQFQLKWEQQSTVRCGI
jgi:hypothetical protein